jgi:hypothetical protein
METAHDEINPLIALRRDLTIAEAKIVELTARIDALTKTTMANAGVATNADKGSNSSKVNTDASASSPIVNSDNNVQGPLLQPIQFNTQESPRTSRRKQGSNPPQMCNRTRRSRSRV